MIKYLAFDIEITKILPEDEDDWKAYRPLGISCAAVLPSDTKKPLVFYGINAALRRFVGKSATAVAFYEYL